MASVSSNDPVNQRPIIGSNTTNEDGTASLNGRRITEATGFAYIKQCLQNIASWFRDLPGRIKDFFITHCRCCACNPDPTLLIGDTTGNDESDIPSDRRTDNNGTVEVIVDSSEDPSDAVFHDRPDALTDIEPTGPSNTPNVTELPSPLSLPNPKPEIPSMKAVILVEKHDFQLEADGAMALEDVIRRRPATLTLPMNHDSLPQNQKGTPNKPTGIVRPHQLSARPSLPSTEGEAIINVVNAPAANTAALTETPKTDDLEDSIDSYSKQERLTARSLDMLNQDSESDTIEPIITSAASMTSTHPLSDTHVEQEKLENHAQSDEVITQPVPIKTPTKDDTLPQDQQKTIDQTIDSGSTVVTPSLEGQTINGSQEAYPFDAEQTDLRLTHLSTKDEKTFNSGL